MPDWLARYDAGEHVQVWREVRALGEKIQSQEYREEAWQLSLQTMRRVRENLAILGKRIPATGYKFADANPIGSPHPDTEKILQDVESKVGPLPMTLKAFYMIVGSVNFGQDFEQLQHRDFWNDADADPGEGEPSLVTKFERWLGEEDPVQVWPVEDLKEELLNKGSRHRRENIAR